MRQTHQCFVQVVAVGELEFVSYNVLAAFRVFVGALHGPNVSASLNQQRPVHIQLGVTLERLGVFGNGNSVGKIARAYGIGSGTVTLYAKRVVTMLMRHYGDYVVSPNGYRREVTSTFYWERLE
ncbi:hypothetical protein PC116_g19503 [Phytophthora cactorum]|uniref:Uncharacterized protein n=1 Tax=Phytophthora cactorum TaxID=29920 RepID=A0A8T1K6I8_9STRA|nr:hypothetical protein Pcac1_g1557 [Phytophthora cactorum]KAG2888717.1 hypothetical protein PC114_g18292 [Phytophthora cactorum]KAG2916171.1 hypothetical protein PC117_g17809 [Phytophthora cactorum]KAG2970953.1 hypothetical protein PC118_g16574 [Phytophthora cactorum]KAG2997586.1 hypothetical protein PC119_g17643 [Phytophthora cactorum]